MTLEWQEAFVKIRGMKVIRQLRGADAGHGMTPDSEHTAVAAQGQSHPPHHGANLTQLQLSFCTFTYQQ